MPKAAERSNKRRTEMLPLSRAERISFTIHVFCVPPPPPLAPPLVQVAFLLSTSAHARVCVCGVGGWGVGVVVVVGGG